MTNKIIIAQKLTQQSNDTEKTTTAGDTDATITWHKILLQVHEILMQQWNDRENHKCAIY